MGDLPNAARENATRRDIFRLGDFTEEQIEHLLATLFEYDSNIRQTKEYARGTFHCDAPQHSDKPTRTELKTRVFMAVVLAWLLIGLALWIVNDLSTTFGIVIGIPLAAATLTLSYQLTLRYESEATDGLSRGAQRARATINRAKAADAAAVSTQVHMTTNATSWAVFQIPADDAWWSANLVPDSSACQLVASLRQQPSNGLSEASQLVRQHHAWTTSWLQRRHDVCTVAGEHTPEARLLARYMTDLADALAPHGPLDTEPPAVAARLRQRCNEAVRHYCSLTHDQAAHACSTGRSATETLLGVLENACAATRLDSQTS